MPDQIHLTPRRMCHSCEAFLGYPHEKDCFYGGVVRYASTVEKFTRVERSDEAPSLDEHDPGYTTRESRRAWGGDATKPQRELREKNGRALGRAAHPKALDRLHEIFPEAEIEVTHGSALPTRIGKVADPVRVKPLVVPGGRFTTVTLSTPDGDVLANTQWTYPPVQWDRRRSLARAFHCLLKDVCERTNEAERILR